jgi:hypothetical protein
MKFGKGESSMTSIETLESVKNKLTPDEYNSIANDLVLLARIWYACTSISKDEIIIDRVRDDGSIAKFVNTERKDLKKMPKKLEFVDFKKSLKYYQWRVKSRTEKIKKYKEMNAPKIIIENEEKLLQRDKDNLTLNRVAVYMYNKGFESGKEFAQMERLKNALFKKPRGRAAKTAMKKSSKKN